MSRIFQPKDKYFYRAKDKGYRARSAFKLLEIQDKFKILSKGMKVLDLGAAPGSWLQVTSEIVGERGKVIGIDLEVIEAVGGNTDTIKVDLYTEDAERIIRQADGNGFDAVLSDLAPKTTGVREVDQARSMELNLRVIELAEQFLKRKGDLIIKIFQSGDLKMIVEKLKTIFEEVNVFKPKASRERSFEVYVIGKKKLK